MEKYTLDILNSEIIFSVRYLEACTVEGRFSSFNGQIELPTINKIDDSKIEVEIDVASINTLEPGRDQHLVSADFFHADKFPKILFKKTHITYLNPKNFVLTGKLQIKGITKDISFKVEAIPKKDSSNSIDSYIYKCTSSLRREDFGLTYGSFLESSPYFIDKVININLHIVLQNYNIIKKSD